MTAPLKPSRARNSEEWNDVAAEWLKTLPQQLWREHSDLVNTELLYRWLPRTRLHRILKTDLFDEVAAKGLYLQLASFASEVIALDISPMVSATARRRYPRLGSLSADVRGIPLSDESIDAIVSLSTLDHFTNKSDIGVALGELLRVLRPGGTLILTLDNPANPVVGLRNRLPYAVTHPLGLVPYPVGRTLRPLEATRAVSNAGFQVEECTAIMHTPRVLAIPLMNAVDRSSHHTIRERVLGAAMRFEKLERFPSRFLTGHFIAIRAVKR
jgi:SAM-dependent methyltransferase